MMAGGDKLTICTNRTYTLEIFDLKWLIGWPWGCMNGKWLGKIVEFEHI
jgi:hypothetical protein